MKINSKLEISNVTENKTIKFLVINIIYVIK